MVLHHAAQIEARRAEVGTGRGITLRELREIAGEVGLTPEVIDQAVAAVQSGARPHAKELLGASLSARLVRGVPGRLSEEAMQRLVRLVEDQVEATGTVTEALGTVRWTSVGRGHKFDRTTQVSLAATSAETQIQVVQRYPSALRAILHLLPASWGAIIGGGIAASSALGPASGIAVAVGAAALGVGIGRTIWETMARRNVREVERVADALAATARELAEE
jgi:hypothetical protein